MLFGMDERVFFAPEHSGTAYTPRCLLKEEIYSLMEPVTSKEFSMFSEKKCEVSLSLE